jgi:hypothetical protein
MATQQIGKDKAVQSASAKYQSLTGTVYDKIYGKGYEPMWIDKLVEGIGLKFVEVMAGLSAPEATAETAYDGGTHIYINGKLYKRIESPDPNRGGTKAK